MYIAQRAAKLMYMIGLLGLAPPPPYIYFVSIQMTVLKKLEEQKKSGQNHMRQSCMDIK